MVDGCFSRLSGSGTFLRGKLRTRGASHLPRQGRARGRSVCLSRGPADTCKTPATQTHPRPKKDSIARVDARYRAAY